MKLELVQRMLTVQDPAILARLQEVINEEVQDSDLSDAELEELEALRAARARGEGRSYTREEVERMAREMVMKP